MATILVCDDERDIGSALKIYLTSEGHDVLIAHNGHEALRLLEENEVHLVLLDIMMPKMDGITALTKLRETMNVPVIFLSAKSEDTDKVLGLNLGADDYITKPFNPVELLARVRSHLRRYMSLGGNGEKKPSVIEIMGLTIDKAQHTVTVDGKDVRLTPTEFEILLLLAENRGTLFSTKEIYSRVWNESVYGADNTVAVHIRHLREKIEIDPANPRYIKVIWGQGYKIV